MNSVEQLLHNVQCVIIWEAGFHLYKPNISVQISSMRSAWIYTACWKVCADNNNPKVNYRSEDNNYNMMLVHTHTNLLLVKNPKLINISCSHLYKQISEFSDLLQSLSCFTRVLTERAVEA